MRNLILGLVCVALVAGVAFAAGGLQDHFTRYGVWNGKLDHKTANYTVTAQDNGKYFDNKGATAAITFTLPAVGGVIEDGFTVGFSEVAAYNVSVDPNGTGSTIIGITNAAGDKIVSSLIGNSVTLQLSGTSWVPVAIRGTWADGN